MKVHKVPRRFRYISRRLVREIVQQEQAVGPLYGKTWSVSLEGVGLALVRRDPDYLNLFDLTHRATKIVKGITGSLKRPSTYVRDEFELSLGHFQVLMGWMDDSHVEIGAMMTALDVPETGTVLIGL